MGTKSFWKQRKIVGGLLGPLVLLALLPVSASAYPRPGQTSLVTRGHDGGQADRSTLWTALSADGRFAVFQSAASNLVPFDRNNREDVFLRDLETGRNELISVSSDGIQADANSSLPVVSAGGRFVAFQSLATNLVPGDSNGLRDIFVRDRVARTTERVSVATGGTEANAEAISFGISVSQNGQFVTFQSRATNLVAGDTNGVSDVFVRDRAAGTTERVSVATDGTEANAAVWSSTGALSADGRFVAFHSSASSLVAGDTNGFSDVFVRDRAAGTTERVSVTSRDEETNGGSAMPALSADGSVVAFHSAASNLVPNDTNQSTDVFVRDRDGGTTERVSLTSAGEEVGSSNTTDISANGRFVLFRSSSTGYVPGDTSKFDVFLHDRVTRSTEWVSRTMDGAPGNDHSWSWIRTMSRDAGRIAFWSTASNIVPGDDNGATDAFILDRGPDVGVGEVSVDAEEVASGWATFSGAVVSTAADPAGDAGPGAEEAGADLLGAEIVHRPEEEDLFIRIRADLLHVPSPLRPNCHEIPPPVGGDICLPGISGIGGGAPGVVYAHRFRVGSEEFEVRALGAAATTVPPSAPGFALFRCEATCTSVTELRGGLGTTGEEVVISVPLHEVGLTGGGTLRELRAEAGFGEMATGIVHRLDEVGLPDATLSVPAVSLGVAPTGSAPEEVAFDIPADLQEGRFTTALDPSSLLSGGDLWAKACLGATCGFASVPLSGAEPSPTPTLTASPTPDPTESPLLPETSEVSFTARSAESGQYSDEVLFEARLTDSDGDAIADRELTFELVGTESTRTFTATTDQGGVAAVAPTLEEKPGSYQLTVRFMGDDSHSGAADTTSLVIDKEDTDLELQVQGQDQDMTLRARLSDLDTPTHGVAGRTIAFTSDGELIGSDETDQDGVASVAVPSDHRNPERTYKATFEGDDFYRASSDDRPGNLPYYFHSSSGSNNLDQIDGAATFDATFPTSEDPANAIDVPGLQNASTEVVDPVWRGELSEPATSLTVDFWGRTLPNQTIGRVNYTVRVSTGAEYFELVPAIRNKTVPVGSSDFIRITHTFDKMVEGGRAVPLKLPDGPFTIAIRGTFTVDNAATEIRFDSVDFPSGFTTSESEPTPTPTPTPTSTSTPTQEPAERGTYPVTPNDPLFGRDSGLFNTVPTQWAPRKILAPQAWQHERATGFGIRVAVLDTGVDLDHEDLQCPGKIAVTADSDVIDNDSDPDDENGHGTHVAGIIGACTNNATGIAGVAPDTTIVPIRVINADGSGTDAQLIASLNRAVAAGAHVINMSLGYLPGKEIINDVSAIDAAIEAAADAGVVLVAAAGNEGSPLCAYPALAEDIVCVGATDPRDAKSWYSNFPVKTDPNDFIGPGVVAPGGTGHQVFCNVHSEEILSTYPEELDNCDEGVAGYLDLNGASMASPHVAGIAALVYDRLGGDRNAASAHAVIDALVESADDLGAPGYDPIFGSGRVNALKAVQAMTPEPDPTTSPTPGETATPEPTPTETATPEPTPTETATPEPTPTESSSPEPTPTETASPTPTESLSPSPSESPEPETATVTFTERSATSGQYSDETLFEARLADSNGDPIAGQELTFELTGAESSRTFTATTDEDGIARVTPTLKEKPGPYQLTVRFSGDEDHAGDADTASFVVEKEDSALELSVQGEDDDKTLRARLSDLDTSSEGIAERTIYFYSDGELIGSQHTDANGVAAVALPPRHRGANRTYETVFQGDGFYLGSSDERAGKGKGKGGNGGGGEGGRTYAGRTLLM